MNDDTQLARWLAGELDAQELEALQKTSRYAMLVRIKENFELIERPHMDTASMMDIIFDKEKTKPKVVPLYQKAWFLTAAASIIIILGLGIFFTLPHNNTAPNGRTVAFTLPDQSEVILNAGSRSGYHSFNWDNSRVISLEGEAYFEVAKGKTFTVTTALGTVTVLGTHFNVKARKNRFDVVCYEGKVRVEYNGHKTILTPHKALRVENGLIAGNIIEAAGNRPAWLSSELVFNEEKFSAVIAEVERRYDIKIKADYQPAQTFSGTLPGNNIDGALNILSRLYHFEIRKEGKIILLKPIHAKR